MGTYLDTLRNKVMVFEINDVQCMTEVHRACTFLTQLSLTTSRKRSFLDSANVLSLDRNRTQTR